MRLIAVTAQYCSLTEFLQFIWLFLKLTKASFTVFYGFCNDFLCALGGTSAPSKQAKKNTYTLSLGILRPGQLFIIHSKVLSF